MALTKIDKLNANYFYLARIFRALASVVRSRSGRRGCVRACLVAMLRVRMHTTETL